MENVFIIEHLKNIDRSFQHASYRLEKKLLEEIKLGLYNDAMETLRKINSVDRATLSKDLIRSTKNSLIGSCTLFTRAVIEGGIAPEEAFSLSDALILTIESLDTLDELSIFEYQMVEQYINLMKSAKEMPYSTYVKRTINYIHINISKTLKISSISEDLSISSDYLARLFKKEVGLSLRDYIHREKIQIAKKFLRYSDKSATDISYLLNYSNPGHFSKQFKKCTGKTPSQYKSNLKK